MKSLVPVRLAATCFLLLAALPAAARPRWTPKQAADWYHLQPWLVGANYTPASAINQLEMWQEATFDPAAIDRELGWAQSIGMNTMRVFLHDLAWDQDQAGFKRRIDQFLTIADKHGIRPLFVLFDSCWDPFPKLGPQHAPVPGVHNSGWVQSPGAQRLTDPAQYQRLERYVKGVIRAFARDRRVLAWDLWNEPDNTNNSSYGSKEPSDKVERVAALLPQVFQWARAANPQQPLTSGVWQGDWSVEEKLSVVERAQLDSSDVISFHDYSEPAKFEARILSLRRYSRPILCTEYMARGNASTFQGSLPIALREHVAAYNWGLVQGKTQTHLPWDSWQKPYVGDRVPSIWFHEVFRANGDPYQQAEVDLIRRLTGRR